MLFIISHQFNGKTGSFFVRPLDVPPLVSTDEEEEDQMEEKSKVWKFEGPRYE